MHGGGIDALDVLWVTRRCHAGGMPRWWGYDGLDGALGETGQVGGVGENLTMGRWEMERKQVVAELAAELVAAGRREDAINFLAGNHGIFTNFEWDGWAMGITVGEVDRAVRAEIDRVYPDIREEEVEDVKESLLGY